MIEVLECEIKEMKSEIDARSIEDINDKTWETLQEVQILHSIVLIILFRHKNDNLHTLKILMMRGIVPDQLLLFVHFPKVPKMGLNG